MGLLGRSHRKDRELAVQHAARSLLAEGEERKADTGGLFYEWFGRNQEKLGKQYRLFAFENSTKRGGAVAGGKLVFTGGAGPDGDSDWCYVRRNGRGRRPLGKPFKFPPSYGENPRGWEPGISELRLAGSGRSIIRG